MNKMSRACVVVVLVLVGCSSDATQMTPVVPIAPEVPLPLPDQETVRNRLFSLLAAGEVTTADSITLVLIRSIRENKRSELVRLTGDPGQLLVEGGVFGFMTPEGIPVKARVRTVSRSQDGSPHWRGFVSDSLGEFSLTQRANGFTGRFGVGARIYSLGALGNGVHVVSQLQLPEGEGVRSGN